LSKRTNALLDIAVKRSLGYDPIKASKWSIVECAKNEYLDPNYDPFHEYFIRKVIADLKAKYKVD
jgi:hypothetical protein